MASENLYEVEALLSYKKIKSVPYYLVKWVGYPDSDNTWEPEKSKAELYFVFELELILLKLYIILCLSYIFVLLKMKISRVICFSVETVYFLCALCKIL